jgi:hypothetical protein
MLGVDGVMLALLHSIWPKFDPSPYSISTTQPPILNIYQSLNIGAHITTGDILSHILYSSREVDRMGKYSEDSETHLLDDLEEYNDINLTSSQGDSRQLWRKNLCFIWLSLLLLYTAALSTVSVISTRLPTVCHDAAQKHFSKT